MNAERLLQHYEKIADEPDAIARLRRFILDLAVRGKLVPQDAKDEPASELLKRIAKEKAQAGKREKVEAEIDNEEELGNLPPMWRAVPLIALGSWAIGSGFPKNEQGLENGPHFFLKVSDMNLPGNVKYITVSNNFIDDDAARRMRAKIHPPGTIIFPKIGGAIATNKRRILTRGSAIDNNCLGITFSSALNVEWAFLLLTTLDFTRYQAGTAVPALQQGVLERIPVGLPPLAEQHRIVAKVDELMGLCDRLEAARAGREAVRDRLAAASLARLNAPDPETFEADARFALDALPALTMRPDQIKRLRQTILNLAVRGKLVPQNANDEPVAIGKRQKFMGESEAPFEAPLGWRWFEFGDVAKLENGDRGKNYPNRDEYVAKGVAWINTGHIQPDGSLSLASMNYITRAKFDALGGGKIRPGDLLYCLRGATFGKTAFVEPFTEGAIASSLMIVRPSDVLDRRFTYLYLISPLGRSQLLRFDNGTAQPNLSSGNVKKYHIAVPPLAEQHRIVVKVDALMALCDQLEASLANTAATRRRLLDALLAEALAPVDARELEAAE